MIFHFISVDSITLTFFWNSKVKKKTLGKQCFALISQPCFTCYFSRPSAAPGVAARADAPARFPVLSENRVTCARELRPVSEERVNGVTVANASENGHGEQSDF